MLPTRYLAAMVYYFVFTAADPKRNVTNKGVAKLFKLAPSNLHKLVSHREKMVTVIKKKVPKVGTSKGASAAAGSAK